MRRPHTPRSDQRGVAVVVVLGLVMVLLTVAVVSAGTVAIVLGHRRAQVAADLAVLAGAGALQRGGDACAAVARIAARHDARVTSCAVEGLAVAASTVVDLPRVLGGREARARSRAGPVQAPDRLTGAVPW